MLFRVVPSIVQIGWEADIQSEDQINDVFEVGLTGIDDIQLWHRWDVR